MSKNNYVTIRLLGSFYYVVTISVHVLCTSKKYANVLTLNVLSADPKDGGVLSTTFFFSYLVGTYQDIISF